MSKEKVVAKKTKQKNNDKKQVVVILDAHAIIHRAYHALPSFSNSSGEPTGALYGIVTMLLKILEEFKPDAIVAAYDLPKPTFRHHAYDGYKAGRAKTDEDLVKQIIRSRDVFAAFGVPMLDAEGFEADDIIGTLAKELEDTSRTIIIASGDMDTLQLVKDDSILVYTLKKGVQDTVLYNEDAVKARYGFDPERLIDFKGLRGDPSDNIIGVPGIGEKTATTLIMEYGTIESIYQALKKDDVKLKTLKITDRIKSILLDHEDDALFSKTLATIRRDAPVVYSVPTEHYYKTINEEKLLQLLSDLEFRSLTPRIKKLFSLSEPDIVITKTDTEILEKAAIALWVFRSDFTMADLDTVLGQTKTKTPAEALARLTEELKQQGSWELYEKLELPLLPIVKKMHERGIMIDVAHFKLLKEQLREKLNGIEVTAEKLIGRSINLGSPKQLSALLFEELELIPKGKRKISGSFTTNAEALEGMKELHPIVPLILEHRETQKLLTTYVEPLIECVHEDGRVYADFYQNGTTTGRFSSAHPNLQNLPAGESGKAIRKGFVAAPGYTFISSDYSQIELRVLAIMSGDTKLTESFARGDDIHNTVASYMFETTADKVTQDMRRAAKVINFGIIYGMGVTALQKNLNTSRAEAAQFYENYFAMFPTIAAYLEGTKREVLSKGYSTTLFGRRRYFPTIKSPLPHLRAFAERMASNAPIQGTAADILKVAMVLIEEDLKVAGLLSSAHLVLQIHDELVYEVKESVTPQVKDIIEKAMQQALARSPIAVPKTDVPLAVSSAVGERLDLLK